MFLFCSRVPGDRVVSVDASSEQPYPTEDDINDLLEEFGGDPRAAIRALLHDLAMLAGDFETSVSKGFVRGGVPRMTKRRA
jgi:hypothetical protein